MKKVYLLSSLALTVALSMSSCSSDGDDTLATGDNTELANNEVYFSFGFGMGSATKAYDGEVNGTATENDVKNVEVILFDGNSGTSSVTFVQTFAASAAEVGTPGYTGSVAPTAGKAFKVNGTSKYMLLVVNPGTDFPTVTTGMTFAAINTAIGTTNAKLTANGFEMSNASGELQDITGNLFATAVAAQTNAATVNVDRAVAKVKMGEVAGINDSNPNAYIGYIGWALNTTNKRYFPLSKRTPTYLATHVTMDVTSAGSYRIDPNYTFAYLNACTLTEEFNTLITPPTTWLGKDDVQYCLENTQDKASNIHKYTTSVLVKAIFTPKKVMNVDPSNGTQSETALTLGDNWISLSGAQYTWATLKNWVVYELNQRKDDADPTSFATPKFDAVKTFLDHKGGSTLTNLTDPATDAATAQAELDAIADAEITTWKGETVGVLNYYAKSENYYHVMIQHDATTTAVNELGEFGVVRNNVYSLSLKKINNPGNPTVQDPTPGDPDEDDQKWLSIEISINPWTAWTQDVEL